MSWIVKVLIQSDFSAVAIIRKQTFRGITFTANGLPQTTKILARPDHLDSCLMGLHRRCKVASSFNYEQLDTFEIYVLLSPVCFLRGSQIADQKLVKSSACLAYELLHAG